MAEEFEPSKAEEVFKSGGGDDIVANVEAAGKAAGAEIAKSTDQTFQDFNQDDVDAYLGRGGNGVASKIPESLKASLDKLKSAAAESTKLAENILKTVDPRVSLTGNYITDFDTETQQGKINNSASKAVDDGVIKKYAGDSTDPNEIIKKLNDAADRFNKKADTETDPKKRYTWKTVATYLGGFLLVAGSIVGTIFGILAAMAKKDTGCYWIQSETAGNGTQLTCTQPNGLQTNCDCSTVVSLQAKNMCNVDISHDCAAKYMYVYQQFDIFNEFNKVMSGIGGDAEKVGGLFQQAIDIFTKYGIWILLGVGLLILIPLFISLFKSFS